MRKSITSLLLALLGIAILAGGLFAFRYLSGKKTPPPKKEIVKRIKEVDTREVVNQEITTTLDVQGRLEAYNKIDLFSEVGGAVIATGKSFKKGTYFKKGSVLLGIDDGETRLNIQSQKASLLNAMAKMMPDLKTDYPESFTAWDTYLDGFSIDAPMESLPVPVTKQEKLFVAGRNIQTQYYAVKSLEDRLSKYVLYAPFSGVLTSTLINKGAVVRSGQQLGQLMATGHYELVATVPLSQLNYLQPGAEVRLVSEDIEGTWTGKVNRISDLVDPNSQTVDVFVGVRGNDLRQGMYLRGSATAKPIDGAVAIDRDLLINESEVYVLSNDSLLRLMPVTVRRFQRNTAIVTGLPDGAELVTSAVAGAYDGMPVRRR
jgi:multidrug efflux pump subunit AcrA (membrane-fusion protein)